MSLVNDGFISWGEGAEENLGHYPSETYLAKRKSTKNEIQATSVRRSSKVGK